MAMAMSDRYLRPFLDMQIGMYGQGQSKASRTSLTDIPATHLLEDQHDIQYIVPR
jgi:hypothetical protein